MLKVSNIDVYYGKVQALFDVSIEITGTETVSVIGSNGAGKSTLMRTIMGLNTPKRGEIIYDGESLVGKKTNDIVKRGIVYVPEGREIFPGLTVLDNLRMGAYTKRYKKEEMENALENVFEIFPRLKERQRQQCGSLSGGEQQMVAIARGLMCSPKLIMFDEPSLGLAPVLVEEMFKVIENIKQTQKIPIILVEQNAFMAMEISDKTYVLDVGEIKSYGDSATLMNSPEIKAAYLGG